MPEREPLQTALPTGESKLLAAFSYILFLSVLVLLWKRNDVFILHHARQGAVLLACFILLWGITLPLNVLLETMVLVAIISGFVHAWHGETWRMPILASLAERIKV